MMNKLVLVFVFLISYSSSIQVYTPESVHIDGFWLRLGTENETIQGQVIRAEPFEGCQEYSNAEDMRGKIALVEAYKCSPQEKIRRAQEAGAIGIIVTCYKKYKGGMGAYWGDGRSHPELVIRALEISRKDSQYLQDFLDTNQTLTVMLSSDKNPWTDIYEGANWLAFSIIFGLVHVVLLIWSGVRVCQKVWDDGLKASLPIIILLLEMGACISRIIILLDPGYTRNIIPYAFSYGIFTLNFSLSIGATLVIAFYWRKISVGLKLNIVPSLKKLKIPTILVICLMLLFQVIDLAIRYSWVNADIHITMLGIIYFTLCMVVGIFFVVTARKLLRIINNNLDPRKRDNPVLKKMKIFMIMNTVGLFGFSLMPGGVGLTYFTPTPMFDVPITHALLTWWVYFFMSIITISHLAVFAYGRDATSSSSGPKNKHTHSSSSVGGSKNVKPTTSSIELSTQTP